MASVVFDDANIMELRTMTAIDIKQVAKWNVQLREDEASKPLSIEEASERYERWFREDLFQGAIFLIGNQAVGYVLYTNRPMDADIRGTDSVYVRQFFIVREARRQKLGTHAFNLFLKELVPSALRCSLQVRASNLFGQRFRESLGFKQESVAYELDRASA